MGHAAPAAGTALRVNLLGRLEARTRDDRAIPLSGRHAQALFALLVLSRRPRSREAIAADLWPDSDTTSSGALRQALWLVRHGLDQAGVDPHAILEIETDTLGIRPTATVDLDTVAFESCLDGPDCTLDTALALYRGDLVEGLGHDCFAAERERLSDRFEDALASVAVADLAAGDHEGARRAAERLLVRDPLREEVHAVLIAVYGLNGSRSQVVRQYRRLCAVLDRELDETPLPETDAIYRQALSRTIGRSLERAATLDQVAVPRPALVVAG